MQVLELLINAGLVVLIWIIQLLHYPSFRFIHADQFTDFARFHGDRISVIVIPLMLSEAFFSLVSRDVVTISLVALIWLSTFLLQVPCHNKLRLGYDKSCIDQLIRTNWIRTGLWSLKLIYLLFLKLTVVE